MPCLAEASSEQPALEHQIFYILIECRIVILHVDKPLLKRRTDY